MAQANTNTALQNKQSEESAAAHQKAMEERTDSETNFNEHARQYSEVVVKYNALATEYEGFQKQVNEMMEKQTGKKLGGSIPASIH